MKTLVTTIGLLLVAAGALAAERSGFGLTVLVSDGPRPEYHARGNTYVEALRGENYTLRITNPTPYRVGVALSVDGLNTIDAKHSDARHAAKWILGPYETAEIEGWQVSDSTARRFFFTGERNSYGAVLGQTDNLGVIEAVFYRERHREVTVYAPRSSANEAQKGAAPPSAAAPSDDYAGTGMGGRTGHEVERVDIDLEQQPAASIRLRYEFRPALVKLGVLGGDPLSRRERAKGVDRYCPERN